LEKAGETLHGAVAVSAVHARGASFLHVEFVPIAFGAGFHFSFAQIVGFGSENFLFELVLDLLVALSLHVEVQYLVLESLASIPVNRDAFTSLFVRKGVNLFHVFHVGVVREVDRFGNCIIRVFLPRGLHTHVPIG